MPDHIFIYGSLRSEFNVPSRRFLEMYAECTGRGSLSGRLYQISWYPGAVKSKKSGDWVHGEIYRILEEEPLLERLDEYEGYSSGQSKNNLFVRSEENIHLSIDSTLPAWIYLYNRSTAGKTRIESGDYAKFMGVSNR